MSGTTRGITEVKEELKIAQAKLSTMSDNNTDHPLLLRQSGLMYKNKDQLGHMNNVRRYETQLHESVKEEYNINNIRKTRKLFLTLHATVNGVLTFFFGLGAVNTLPLLITDYKPGDPMYRLWDEFTKLPISKKDITFTVTRVSCEEENTCYIYYTVLNSTAPSESRLEYNGEYAYEVDGSGKVISEDNPILYIHEFKPTKSYILKKNDEEFTKIEMKVNELKNAPEYDRIRVDIEFIELYHKESKTFRPLKDFPGITIQRISQYQSQDMVIMG